MDDLNVPVLLKGRKVLRYVRLYGPSRTYVKVLQKLHMQRVFDRLPPNDRRATSRQTVGIVGSGQYAFGNIAYFLRRRRGHVVRGVMDVDVNRAASLCRRYGASYYTTDAERILGDPAIRLVYVASNHASHAEYAIRGLEQGKHVYIEKPHVVSEEQLVRLVEAMKRAPGEVFLGFNRPMSRLGAASRRFLAAESGPGTYMWFVVGHYLPPDHWYHKPEEGGRVLGNFCHWTDFTLRLLPPDAYPIEINPTRAGVADDDVVATYRCGDGTIAVIAFSSKEEPFEGIRERFVAHRGHCLLDLHDFQCMTVDIGERRRTYRSLFRDQGHEASIVSSFDRVTRGTAQDREAVIAHVWNSARLFLDTKLALERDSRVAVLPYPG